MIFLFNSDDPLRLFSLLAFTYVSSVDFLLIGSTDSLQRKYPVEASAGSIGLWLDPSSLFLRTFQMVLMTTRFGEHCFLHQCTGRRLFVCLFVCLRVSEIQEKATEIILGGKAAIDWLLFMK